MLEILQKLCDVYLFAHLCLVSTSGESNSIRLYKLGLQKFEESQNFEFWERGRKLRKPLDIYIIITFIIISVIIITTPSPSSLSNLWMWPGHIPDDHTATDALAKPEIDEYLSNVVGIIANILLSWTVVGIFANVTSVEMPLSPDLTNHQYSTLWHRELAT